MLGHIFRGATMAARPYGPGQGSTNRLSILASHSELPPPLNLSSEFEAGFQPSIVRDPQDHSKESYPIHFPLRLIGCTPEQANESFASIIGRDQGYADIPIALRNIFTQLPTGIFWDRGFYAA